MQIFGILLAVSSFSYSSIASERLACVQYDVPDRHYEPLVKVDDQLLQNMDKDQVVRLYGEFYNDYVKQFNVHMSDISSLLDVNRELRNACEDLMKEKNDNEQDVLDKLVEIEQLL